MQNSTPILELPELNYSYSALEPILISDILETHHKLHHQAYINNYNKLMDQFIDNHYKGNITEVQNLCSKIAFNAGGHNCHALYWQNLAPIENGGGILPDSGSPLTSAIVKEWGSYDNFIKNFNTKTAGIQGSGWGWLAFNPLTKELSIEQSVNQDSCEKDGL